MPADPMRGAIVGCGFFAQFQIEAWKRMPEVELAAACDLDVSRARQAAGRAYASAEELIERERPDFIDIATRPETHLELVRLCARHRIPVVCQKPMAPRWKDCVAMVDAAATSGSRLMIHENWRWQPWYRETKRLLESGAIGQPIGYRFRTVKRDGLGAEPYPDQPYFRHMPRLLIYETIVHHLDTARFLFGEFRSVFARTRKLNERIAGEDQAHLSLEHSDGLLGTIEGNRWTDTEPKNAPGLGECWIDGEEGRLMISAMGDILVDGAVVWKNEVSSGYRGDSVLATQRHFVQGLRDDTPWESEGFSYLKTVAAVEASYESAAARRAAAL